jgi:succinate-semialdehyde dehydrogenase / glutarate-semialdehyde dehydrogenase
MLFCNEEGFGPVAPLFPFDDEADVIREANDTPYGVAACYYTQYLRRIERVSAALEAGRGVEIPHGRA